MTLFRQYARLFSLSLVYAGNMALPYIHFKFYDIIKEATQATNAELGTLMTVYIVASMILYIPGGVLADRYSVKKVIILNAIVTMFCNVFFAFYHSYAIAIVIWIILGLTTTGLVWPALIKAVRDSGSKSDQGKMFGFFYGFQGLVMVVIGFVGAAVFASFTEQIDGLKYLLLAQAGFLIAGIIALAIYLEDKTEFSATEVEQSEQPPVIEGLLKVIKMGSAWLLLTIIFCGYGLYIGMGYMTPYTTNVLGVSIAMGAVLGTIRVYGIRIFTGPFSGWLVDKIGEPSKIMMVAFLALIAMLMVLLYIPSGTSANVIIAITMFTSFVCMMQYCVAYACMEEVSIPPTLTATVVSFVSLLGYLPDAIFSPLFGYWLDIYGSQEGYVVIFKFLTLMAVFGFLASVGIYRIGQKNKKNLAS